MATRSPLTFSPEDLRVLSSERYTHPDPRVQRRMEVLWLISQGETQARAGILAGASKATVERYVAIYRSGGVTGLRQFHWVKPVSALETHRGSLEQSFREHPPHTVAEACERIKALTGVERGAISLLRFFLGFSSGFSFPGLGSAVEIVMRGTIALENAASVPRNGSTTNQTSVRTRQ